MSLLRRGHHTLAIVLLALFAGNAEARATIEVEVSKGASAFPVLIDNPLTLAFGISEKDTVIAGEKARIILSPDSIAPAPVAAMRDTLAQDVDTARLRQLTDSVTGKKFVKESVKAVKPAFVPNPIRALWLSLVFPGAGQIYNRKYWKLPFVYGGFIGCTYALMWNQMMYRDYSQAYLDIMDDDPNTKSYMEMLPPRYDITGREEQFKTIFKRKKDYYRRYRDLSAFCFVGVYLLSVIDAYVDAQLSVFDITPDLSMSVEPAVLNTPTVAGKRGAGAYGVGCSLRF